MNYNKQEKILNDENILKSYNEIKLNKKCRTYKNIIAKFSNTILGVGGIYDIYLINIANMELVKTITILERNTFCSFYIGDFNTIFILSMYGKTVSTYDGDFTVYYTSHCCFQFFENNLELNYLPRPKCKNDVNCLII